MNTQQAHVEMPPQAVVDYARQRLGENFDTSSVFIWWKSGDIAKISVKGLFNEADTLLHGNFELFSLDEQLLVLMVTPDDIERSGRPRDMVQRMFERLHSKL